MVFSPPPLDALELGVIDEVERLRAELRLGEPRRWHGRLRRMALARAIQGSNSIEGYEATIEDADAIAAGEEPLDATTETALALAGYRDAMTYVLQMSSDEDAVLDEGQLKALHFMMIKHDLSKHPGQWRPGPIYVHNAETDAIVYTGPERARVPGLIQEMLAQLNRDDGTPVLVRAAMAHLNLAMIHPCSDGNGRLARCVQTLVLARARIMHPIFASIEEYLGENTQDYYDVLATVGQGSWHPENDAMPWIRFCLLAHYRQAHTHLKRVRRSEDLWIRCSAIADEQGLPDRAVGALFDAASRFRLRNGTYRGLVRITAGEEITDLTASRDLKLLVSKGLLSAIGQTRARVYVAAEELRAVGEEVRAAHAKRPIPDPFANGSDGPLPGQLVLATTD
jgi:Fic family protein